MAIWKKNIIFAHKTMTIMKKVLTAFVLLLVCHLLQAAPVTLEQAQQVARQFMGTQPRMAMNMHRARLASWQPREKTLGLAADEALYYVFNVGDDEGFVIVSGDDRTMPVLGYADSGTFDAEQLPAEVRAWLQGYADQLEYLSQHPKTLPFRAGSSNSAIAPLLTCHWGQTSPYNSKLMTDPVTGETCVTGCVATAMAQVMYYWKYPAKTKAYIPGYTTLTRSIYLSSYEPTTINWSYMKDVVTEQDSKNTRDAVGMLMALCGASVTMDYTSNASNSSADRIPKALKTYFGYASSTQLLNRNHYRAAQWNQIIYDELKAQRPVIYAGSSSGGGHAFVIDGYDGNGLFHVNWGWSGKSDGYFLLSALDSDSNDGAGASSSTDGYNFMQQAIVGMTPTEGLLPSAPVCLSSYGIGLSGASTTTRQGNNTFHIDLTATFCNLTAETQRFDAAIGVFDKNDVLKEVLGSFTDEYASGNGYLDLPFSLDFGAALGNGDYTLKAISRLTGSGADWSPNFDSNKFAIEVKISNNTATYTAPNLNLSATIQAKGSAETEADSHLLITLKNNGTYFADDLYLLVDGNLASGCHVELAPGAQTQVEMSFTPQSVGVNQAELMYQYGGNLVKVASANINVVQGSKTKQLNDQITIMNIADGVLASSTVKAKVHLENTGNYTYSNSVALCLYKKVGSSFGRIEYQTKKIFLLKGQQGDLTFEFTGLDDLSRYALSTQYVTDGAFKPTNNYVYFNTDFSAQQGIVAPVVEADGMVTVYTLDGRVAARTSRAEQSSVLQTLPKGLYISDGKKILNR